ncbi:MAG: hypothetical protein COS49_00535 [Candidatus Portnoybacteria bacterium CG03_land_8_20_14_0_80_41_10]|uniref:Uncharacterized protein n=1 Tax=Candidatus Portnoybacteria bacterium CG03_land_8_20_14_0_80_41_10 TaxID=1974808 RepID=A0A2M7BV24_9BACT|nr:MAG: hypothetical protein COS49_00535 [Candidatus Portnoybacteria bacterium CG03_land_8_20_14_0_80_41_10]
MSLSKFLEKIQNKPRYIRFQILCLTVFACMFLIVSLWVVSLKHSLPGTAEKTNQSIGKIKEEIGKETPSLKEIFQASIGVFFEKNSLLEEETVSGESQPEPAQKDEDIFEKRTIKPAKLPLSD